MEKMEMLYLISQMLKIDLSNRVELTGSCLKIYMGKTSTTFKISKI